MLTFVAADQYVCSTSDCDCYTGLKLCLRVHEAAIQSAASLHEHVLSPDSLLLVQAWTPSSCGYCTISKSTKFQLLATTRMAARCVAIYHTSHVGWAVKYQISHVLH